MGRTLDMVDKTIYGRVGWPGLPMCMSSLPVCMAEDKPESDAIHDRVDQVIQDLAGNRVAPRKVDELKGAVNRTGRDSGVFRAIR